MKRRLESLRVSATVACIALLQLANPAAADPPIWAWARGVKATDTNCGGVHQLILRGNAVNVPTQSNTPGCKSSEITYQYLIVSKSFFARGNNGQISAQLADAGHIDCDKGESGLILGRSTGDIERERRLLGPTPDCTYRTWRYQLVSSLGSIPFKDSPNPGTMSVAESLAMHAKERQQVIAACNANPICRAEVARMRSRQGSGGTAKDCSGNGNYTTYNGNGGCSNSNGVLDPERHSPH